MTEATEIPGGIFRDPREGASARREHLLRQRRAEYALMPHTLRRIYVRRVARAITGATAAVAGAVLMLAALAPSFHAALARLVPGMSPAVLSTVLLAGWILTAITYFVARCYAEDRYARITSSTVRASGDVFGDLDRLSQLKPFAVAARMAERVELPSVALPLLGLAMLLPATAVFGWLWVRAGAFPNPALFEAKLFLHVGTMLPAMALLAGLSFAFAHRLRRKSHDELVGPGRLGDSVALALGALVVTTFAAAIGTGAVLAGAGLLGFVVAAHVATARVAGERAHIELGHHASASPSAPAWTTSTEQGA